jgi:hypothetical protein
MRGAESGNVFIYILGAIVLMGLLVVLVKGNSTPGGGIDNESTIIRVSEVQQYAAELERGIGFIMQNGNSEADIRFAHTNAPVAYGAVTAPLTRQVFSKEGGAASYRAPPSGVQTAITPWQFFGNTHIKGIGTDTAGSRRAELIAVLPNVTEAFCLRVNEVNGQNLTLTANHDPAASGCVYAPGSEFTGTFTEGAGTNTIDDTLFTQTPAKQACIKCETGGLHFYHVLMSR